VLLTKRFVRLARRAGIREADLCTAAQAVMSGQADDLGGGVWKKRLDGNRRRAIILAKGGRIWVYEHLFAKQDQANIGDRDLMILRTLAKQYAAMRDEDFDTLVRNQGWKEICHGQSTEVQE
jgi:hypothetical protein